MSQDIRLDVQYGWQDCRSKNETTLQWFEFINLKIMVFVRSCSSDKPDPSLNKGHKITTLTGRIFMKFNMNTWHCIPFNHSTNITAVRMYDVQTYTAV